MMVILGVKLFLDGLWALDRSDTAVAELYYTEDLGTWGWIWLISGVIVFVAGIAVFNRAPWARVVGIAAAIIAAWVNLSWLYFYPISALIGVIIAILVIYGLAAYGEE